MKTYRLQSIFMLLALLAVNFFTALWLQGTSIPTAWASALGQEAPAQTGDASAASTSFVMPATFNYQGYVRNPDGTLMTGPHKITARLWNVPVGGDEQNNLKYTDSFTDVPVRDGLFNIVLGEDPLFPPDLFQNNASLFLGITLDPSTGSQELIPRQRLHAVPWALSASTLTPGATVNLNGLTNNGLTTLNAPVALNSDVTVKAYREIRDSADKIIAPYDMSLRRYTVETQDNKAPRTSVPVDDTILRQLCADEDGCTVHLGMREWDAKFQGTGLIAMLGPIRFSLGQPVDGKRWWRSEGIQSNGSRFSSENMDSDGVAQSPLVAWDCNFTDSKFSTGSDLGDSDQGFSLFKMYQDYLRPAMTCVLTIDD